MKRVRDKAIEDWEKLISGQMKGARADRIRQQLLSFGPEQKDALTKLLPQIVDTTLYHLLWSLEQQETFELMARDNNGELQSIRNISDGLSGELYSDRGWISRFSSKSKSPL